MLYYVSACRTPVAPIDLFQFLRDDLIECPIYHSGIDIAVQQDGQCLRHLVSDFFPVFFLFHFPLSFSLKIPGLRYRGNRLEESPGVFVTGTPEIQSWVKAMHTRFLCQTLSGSDQTEVACVLCGNVLDFLELFRLGDGCSAESFSVLGELYTTDRSADAFTRLVVLRPDVQNAVHIASGVEGLLDLVRRERIATLVDTGRTLCWQRVVCRQLDVACIAIVCLGITVTDEEAHWVVRDFIPCGLALGVVQLAPLVQKDFTAGFHDELVVFAVLGDQEMDRVAWLAFLWWFFRISQSGE
nr:MAG TPA: hypothetical protein [Caudoviricetes sp.]